MTKVDRRRVAERRVEIKFTMLPSLIEQIDLLTEPRGRSAFIEQAVMGKLRQFRKRLEAAQQEMQEDGRERPAA